MMMAFEKLHRDINCLQQQGAAIKAAQKYYGTQMLGLSEDEDPDIKTLSYTKVGVLLSIATLIAWMTELLTRGDRPLYKLLENLRDRLTNTDRELHWEYWSEWKHWAVTEIHGVMFPNNKMLFSLEYVVLDEMRHRQVGISFSSRTGEVWLNLYHNDKVYRLYNIYDNSPGLKEVIDEYNK
jgi:hypothetical protein